MENTCSLLLLRFSVAILHAGTFPCQGECSKAGLVFHMGKADHCLDRCGRGILGKVPRSLYLTVWVIRGLVHHVECVLRQGSYAIVKVLMALQMLFLLDLSPRGGGNSQAQMPGQGPAVLSPG